MAGSQFVRLRINWFAASFALSVFTFAGYARAQTPLSLNGSPAASAVGLTNTQSAPESAGPPPAVPPPLSCPAASVPSTDDWLEGGHFETIAESIFGQPDPNCWHPLSLSSLFSEGWNESWVPSPSGSGGAPRQGWINAADGNLYRLTFFTFAQGFNNSPSSNAYLGANTILLPLSRRVELIVNTPFVLQNNAASGLPVIGSGPTSAPTTKSFTTFGDVSFTPRVLLYESKDFSLTAEVAVQTPTGNQPLAGNTSVTPAFGFWNNFSGGWVVRGGMGVNLPTQSSGNDTLISQLAIGQTVTPHDVPLFGDFTYYLSAVAGTPLSSGETTVSLTPGMRTHLGNDWYFLAGLPTPVTKQRVAELGMILWFMKAW